MSNIWYIVFIDGSSGSGKTTFANNLLKGFPSKKVVIVNCDRFYRDPLPDEDKTNRNYDHPDAFDKELLFETVRKISCGETVFLPRYNYVTHMRDKDAIDICVPGDINIFEGILIYYWPELRTLVDLPIYIDVKQDECVMRRTQRDIVERNRTMESVFNQYRETVAPAFEKYIKPLKKIIAQSGGIIVPKGGHNMKGYSNVIGRIAYDLSMISH
jgi:uridine kinase